MIQFPIWESYKMHSMLYNRFNRAYLEKKKKGFRKIIDDNYQI